MAPSFFPAAGRHEVEITGVGVATADGIPLERAALVMSELQRPELDEHGEPTGERVPLEGAELVAAAREWAARAGLTIGDGDPAEDGAPLPAIPEGVVAFPPDGDPATPFSASSPPLLGTDTAVSQPPAAFAPAPIAEPAGPALEV